MSTQTCTVEGCKGEIYVKKLGYCQKHYARHNRYGDVTINKKVKARCTVEGCDKFVAGNGLCDTHYRRMRRYGSTELPTRPTVCTKPECAEPVVSKGLCEVHYRRSLRGETGARACVQCGTAIPDSAHGKRKFCSKACLDKSISISQRENHRDVWLARKYGISEKQYDQLLREQRGKCRICGSKDPRGQSKSPYFQVDHDHKTGVVRGLLCAPCNVGLGSFGDSPELLRKAIEYLMR